MLCTSPQKKFADSHLNNLTELILMESQKRDDTFFGIKVYGYTSMFSSIFTKGDNFHNFLFDFVGSLFIKIGSTLNGKNLLLEERILSFLELTAIQKGGKNKNGRVDSPESVPIHLKINGYIFK